MTSVLNYFLEANLALCAFLLFYTIVLRKETNFSYKRMVLLSGIVMCLLFPAFHLKGTPLPLPSIGEALNLRFLPEMVVVGASDHEGNAISMGSPVNIILVLYLTVAALFLIIFVIRIANVFSIIRNSSASKQGNLMIAESTDPIAPFSFFHFIVIGRSDQLTSKEKQLIIDHEAVHARQLHSMDILLLNILGIVFWFNPVLRIYKKIFIQLHEYEADARSVQDDEVNDYCNLLARVALLSADISIANHFSSSLTLKRIQMLKTIKLSMKPWKQWIVLSAFPLFFILLSCQDQLVNEATNLARSSTVALDVPDEVQRQYDDLKSKNPNHNLLLMEIDDSKLQDLENIQKSVEEKGKIISVNFIKPSTEESSKRNFLIIQYDENVRALAGRASQDNVYTIVEESAAPAEGLEKFYEFLGNTISYPADARAKGIEGKIFVSFIIETDGTLSDFSIAKSVDEQLDAEALRVVKLSSKWKAARHEGAPVRQRMVLPINFKIGDKSDAKKVGFFVPLNPVEHLNRKDKNHC